MNDLVRFAMSVEYATGKKRGRRPVFSSNKFYPYKEELQLQQATGKELERFIGEAYGVAISGEAFAFTDDLNALSNLTEDLPDSFKSEVSAIGRAIGQNVSNVIANSSEMIVGKPYYPPAAKDEIFKTWEANFQMLCKSAESDIKKDISRIVAQAKNEGWNGKQVEKAVKKELPEKYKNRAELISRTEAAKLNTQATISTYRQIGCQYYKWMSTLDERVRPTHEKMNDQICSIENPEVYYDETPDGLVEHSRGDDMVHLHPGEDFQCRCTMVIWDPAIDGKYDVKEKPEEEKTEASEQRTENDPASRELEKANERLAEQEKELERAEKGREKAEKELEQEKTARKTAEKEAASEKSSRKAAENAQKEAEEAEKAQKTRAVKAEKRAEKAEERVAKVEIEKAAAEKEKEAAISAKVKAELETGKVKKRNEILTNANERHSKRTLEQRQEIQTRWEVRRALPYSAWKIAKEAGVQEKTGVNYKEEVEKKLKKRTQDYRIACRLIDAKYSRTYQKGAFARFLPKENKVLIGIGCVFTNLRGPGSSLLHESGHALDFAIGKALGYGRHISVSKNFGEKIIKELTETLFQEADNYIALHPQFEKGWSQNRKRQRYFEIKFIESEYMDSKHKDVPTRFIKTLDGDNHLISAFSDIINGVSDGKIDIAYHHKYSYWNAESVGKETFTHIGTLSESAEGVSLLETYLPQNYLRWKEFIKLGADVVNNQRLSRNRP